jgi:hypothetical protein
MTATDVMLGPSMDRLQRTSLLVGVVFLVITAIGLFVDPGQFFRSYLFAYIYTLGLSIGCLGILLLHHTVGGKWGVVTRRLLESGTRTFPLMAVALIPVLFGMTSLYFWARPEIAEHDAALKLKTGYLNVPFFIVRMAIYFSLWMLYAWILNRKSLEQDRTGDPGLIVRMRQISAPGLVVFTLAGTFAFFDLIMSLEPHWFSTIYGAMFLVGEMLETFAFLIAILVLLYRRPPLSEILTQRHFHDLGNLMLAFTILWAYLSFSQFLIIWSGNLPEEIPWYIRRISGGWGVIAVLLIVFHFFAPFFILLSRFVKKNPNLLQKVAIGMIVIRLLDVYWVVEPAFYQDELELHGQVFRLHWLDFAAPIGLMGVWIAFFIWQLKRYPIVPVKDPRLMGEPKQMVSGLT